MSLRENICDVTFREDAQKARTGNQPAAYAAVRNLAIGAARKTGFADIACARCYYARGDQTSSLSTDTPERSSTAGGYELW